MYGEGKGESVRHCEWVTARGYCKRPPVRRVEMQAKEPGYSPTSCELCLQHTRIVEDGRAEDYWWVLTEPLEPSPITKEK